MTDFGRASSILVLGTTAISKQATVQLLTGCWKVGSRKIVEKTGNAIPLF